jgi:hypothetical protein
MFASSYNGIATDRQMEEHCWSTSEKAQSSITCHSMPRFTHVHSRQMGTTLRYPTTTVFKSGKHLVSSSENSLLLCYTGRIRVIRTRLLGLLGLRLDGMSTPQRERGADDRYFLSTSRDMTARLWTLDPLEGFKPKSFGGHRDVVLGAWFSKDEKTVRLISMIVC